MMNRKNRWWIGVGVAAALTVAAGTGCGAPADDAPAGASAEAAPGPTVQPVELPPLDALEEPARAQIREQRARIDALADTAAVDVRAAAQGRLGQLLLVYDFPDAAQRALLNAVALAPGDRRWVYYLGYLNEAQARPEAAARYYEQARALAPDDAATLVALGRVYRELARSGEALAVLRRAVELDPQNAFAHYLLGQLAEAPAQAVSHYERALELQPQATLVHYPLALAYRDLGDPAKSRYHLERRGEGAVPTTDSLLIQLRRLRQGGSSRYLQAQQLMERRFYPQAVALLKQVIEEAPGDPEGYLTLGAAYGEMGRLDEALPMFERAVALDPGNAKSHYNLGVIYDIQRRPEDALQHFGTAVRIDPGYAEAHYAIARMHWRRRACTEALPHFRAYLDAFADQVPARIHYAICLVQAGRPAEAKAVLEAGRAGAPEHAGLKDALARVLAASDAAGVRDAARAVALAEEVFRTLPRPETLETLAMAYAEAGRFAEAVQRQQEALRALDQFGLASWEPHMTANLARYRQETPSRSPWAAVVFERSF